MDGVGTLIDAALGWLETNKEWVFSGIGVAVIGALVALIKWIFARRRSGASQPQLEDAAVYRRRDKDIEAPTGPAKSAHTPNPTHTFRASLRDGGAGPEMVVIPAGSFSMGSPKDEPGRTSDEGPRHPVEIAQPFALGKTLVTFADYDRFAAATDREKPDDRGWGRDSRPAINVSWEDAVAYANWLCGQSGRHYRLPSEAEWEYACRAGTQTQWSFGENETDAGKYAWYEENADNKTHPVGKKGSNPWGLHDVHGNVSEWVQDCWHDSYDGAPTNGSPWQEVRGNDRGRRVACGGSWKDKLPHARRTRDLSEPEDGKGYSDVGFRLVELTKNQPPVRRVVRGGSWLSKPEHLRSAYRDRHEPDSCINDIGFRLAQDL